MILFLLFISLILHLITFIVLRTLFSKLKKNAQAEVKSQQDTKEIEALFEAYLAEIQEENEKLMSALYQDDITTDTRHSISDKSQSEDSFTLDPSSTYQKKTTIKENPAYTPPINNAAEDVVEQSFHARIYALKDQGYSTEEIARKLDCGKTEVGLMLKFHPKNT